MEDQEWFFPVGDDFHLQKKKEKNNKKTDGQERSVTFQQISWKLDCCGRHGPA